MERSEVGGGSGGPLGRHSAGSVSTGGEVAEVELGAATLPGWKASDTARFWAKVDRSGGPDACWLWRAGLNPDGYGDFGLLRRAIRAHQVVKGRAPKGLEIDHLCRVRHCVNPAHLAFVTHAENVARGGWAMKTHCPKGHAYDVANTTTYRGKRYCNACHKQRASDNKLNPEWQERRRAYLADPERKAVHAARERERRKLKSYQRALVPRGS